MVHSSLSIALLLALVSINMVAADEKEELYSRLFASEAEILDADEVHTLLTKIQAYTPEPSNDLNQIDLVEVKNLINARRPSSDRCRSYEQFAKFFKRLADRRNWKEDEDGISANHYSDKTVSDWNANIKHYITDCMRKQFDLCAEQFKGPMESLSRDDERTINEITNLLGGSLYRDGIIEKMAQTFGERFKGNKVSKRNVKKEVGKSFGRLEAACKSVEHKSLPLKNFMENIFWSDDYSYLLDSRTKGLVVKMLFCEYVLQQNQYISMRLVKQISETY